LADFNNPTYFRVERMLTISLVKAVIAVGPADDESYCPELAKLVMNSVNVEAAYLGKLTHISLPTWRGKELPQKSCPHLRKQDI
jgi:hypothetical protein